MDALAKQGWTLGAQQVKALQNMVQLGAEEAVGRGKDTAMLSREAQLYVEQQRLLSQARNARAAGEVGKMRGALTELKALRAWKPPRACRLVQNRSTTPPCAAIPD
jgi:hypothetical protein